MNSSNKKSSKNHKQLDVEEMKGKKTYRLRKQTQKELEKEIKEYANK